MEQFENENILIGISGGINSAAVLCQLIESGVKPKSVYLFYAHFKEHSDDTFRFVKDQFRLAKKMLPNVRCTIERHSILEFFEGRHMIPHPMHSPCSVELKIDRINKHAFENLVFIDLVGYVKHELKKRGNRQTKNAQTDMFSLSKTYPIGEFTDEWCFEIVLKHIGWYPAIYHIQRNGKRVFKHNNCLPCKNMNTAEMEDVKTYFPEKWAKAMELSEKLNKYWGRDEAAFYATFGRDLGQESTCGNCVW